MENREVGINEIRMWCWYIMSGCLFFMVGGWKLLLAITLWGMAVEMALKLKMTKESK